MIEMSVDDKETVLPSERPGDASLTPPPTQLLDKCSENHQQPLEKSTPKQEGTHSPADRGSEDPKEPQELQEPEKHGSDDIDNHAGPDNSTQSQNGVQQPKSQQRLNKRRSTMSSGFKHPVFGKRRRRANSESESVLPTNFYLGGNIFDPLNLNSMLDEEVNQALNAETPKSSPLPVKNRDPVEILIPRDITDPLNLNSSTAGDEGLLLSPLKSGGGGGRRRHRNRHHGIIGVGGSGGKGGEVGVLPQIGDLSEAEKGKTCPSSQTETEMMLTSTSSEPNMDCVASEPPEKEVLESNSVPNQGTERSSALNSSTDSGEAKQDDKSTSSASVLDTSNPTPSTTISPTATPAVPASHRQRKRKRTSSKSENFGATYCDKANQGTTMTTSSGSTSTSTSSFNGGQPQANRNQGAGLQSSSTQQQHPNQRKNQKNQQKPNQQHHQQQQQQKKKKFQYGNYDKYYGYRNPGLTEDPRLRTLKPEWFRGKEVLDLGCNTGRLTLSIAMNWRPSRIVGLDIDGALIHAARKNILYFLSEMHVKKSRSGEKDESGDKEEKPEMTSLEKNDKSEISVDMEVGKEGPEGEKDGAKKEKEMEERSEKVVEKRLEDGVDGDKGGEAASASSASSSNGNCVFPVSLRISRGPIAAPLLPDTKPPSPGNFPANVSFVKGNYVLDSDLLLVTQREEFDVILCLSVTKWVHLNWGDVGLKRLFHRVYRHLRPGGIFILEPQPWNSYSKRKKLTEMITKNYYSICLKPEQFSTYLISEVGFSSYELIGTPCNLSRGFQRPIYLFHKGPAPQK